MDWLTSESVGIILNLIFTFFGAAYLVAIIFGLRLLKSQNKPYETMTAFIQVSQEAQGKIIGRNSESLDGVKVAFTALTTLIESKDIRLYEEVQNIMTSQLRLEKSQESGILIFNTNLEVVRYTESALRILGWGKEHLPVEMDMDTPTMLTAASLPFTTAKCPITEALKKREAVKNIPLQIYNEHDGTFQWVLVSAYPSFEGYESESWITAFIRPLENMGSV